MRIPAVPTLRQDQGARCGSGPTALSIERWEGTLEYNTLTSEVRSRKEGLDKLRKLVADLRLHLAWYDAFDPVAAASLATDAEATAANREIQLAELEEAFKNSRDVAESLRSAARFGWNPHNWFSGTRLAAKIELAQCRADLEKSEANKRRYVDERDGALAQLADVRESLERYSKFDREAAAGNLAGLAIDIERSGAELDKWEAREKALDKELEAPMRELSGLRSRLQSLRSDIGTAERFKRQLGEAKNSFEKKQIHEECKRKLDNGSPGKVINEAQKAIERGERDITKLERRLQELGRRGALNVQALVIDGSNLCYQGGRLIGISALRALCACLASNLEVTVVFDASTRERLGVPSDEILRSQFPGVKVYVDASHSGADETILDTAQNPATYVVSNDRFAEFPEKPAVRDGRLIRHMIIDGRILVPDLKIDVNFSNRR